MSGKKKKKPSSSKTPKQKYPYDSKVPKQKIPSDRIPKRKTDVNDLLPPKKPKTKRPSAAPTKSDFRSDTNSRNSKSIPKEKIVTKTPKGTRFKENSRNSKSIPKQKIPEEKIPKQDQFHTSKSPSYIPDDEDSKRKTKKESVPPRREIFKEIIPLDSKAVEKQERERRESAPPINDKDKFSEIEEMESRPIPKEEKEKQPKKEREAPATSQIEETEEKVPKQKHPTQKYPSHSKKPTQKKPK